MYIIPSCSCRTSTEIAKFFHDQKLVQFLIMGLNDNCYTWVQGGIIDDATFAKYIAQAYTVLFHYFDLDGGVYLISIQN